MARTCSAIALTLIILMLIAVAACSQKNDTFVLPTRLVLTTPTETATASATATETPIPTATATTTPAPPTGTFTPRFTPSNTFSPTPTPSDTPPATPTLTAAPTLQAQLFGILSSYIDQNTIVRRIADLENFDTRHTNSMRNNGVEGIDAARLYLSALWTGQAATCAASASFYEDAFTITYRDVSSIQSNLVLEVRGTQPGNGVIIVGAHYDTISKDERLNPYGFQPGADDNASGVSATMELARLYCLQPRQKTVVFVLFAAEEIRIGDIAGRQGSRQFVNRFIGSRGWHVDAMINLDTIGSATDTRGELVSNIARLYSAGPNDSPSRQLARR
ncbi:MAG TPA: M28 family peptidase, partial [Aggregatilineales bacterium]|nr:M28 family peptidase [Aggregatilineales bacterium]